MSETARTIKLFIVWIKTQFRTKIQIFRSDNANKYVSWYVDNFL